jgi:hypothetical protein
MMGYTFSEIFLSRPPLLHICMGDKITGPSATLSPLHN